MDAQILVNIANDYNKREAYILKPTKSVVLPNQTNSNTHNDVTLQKGGSEQLYKTTHIGTNNTQLITAEENVKKAREALYELMASDLHGEN